jgi:hypothetical protein
VHFQRILGTWTWRHGALAGISVILFAAALYLLLAHFPADDTADLQAASRRIDARIRPGELVILHPPGNAWYVDLFDGHPVLAPRKLDASDVEHATGLWFVTDRGDQRVRQVFNTAIRRFKRQGHVRFGSVTVFHYWEPKARGAK